MDIKDLARKLKVRPKTIRNRLSNGTWPIPPLRIGRTLRWRESEVEIFMCGQGPITEVTDGRE
jgi:predicted DNA-binding transcriptional regulator AlpA